MKCDNCIHKEVCEKKPPESYPRVMIDTITENCEYYTNAADVQPVVHGRWIPQFVSSRGLADMFSCSVCNGSAFTSHKYSGCPYKYCNHCGAKMDGDRDD